MALNEGGKNLNQLRDEIGLTSSAILHSMRNMGIENLILKTKEGYFLTNIGKSQAILLNGLINSMSALSKTEDFWLNHDISGIPEVLLREIGDLRDCEVVKATPDDLLKTFSNYMRLVTRAKEIKCVSSIFYPEFPNMVKTLVNRKSDVELVLTRNVVDKVMEKHLSILKNLIYESNFELWVIDEEVKVAFTITESALSFALFLNDGTYDVSTDLIAYGTDAVDWGRKLFEYYRKRAKKIGPEDI